MAEDAPEAPVAAEEDAAAAASHEAPKETKAQKKRRRRNKKKAAEAGGGDGEDGDEAKGAESTAAGTSAGSGSGSGGGSGSGSATGSGSGSGAGAGGGSEGTAAPAAGPRKIKRDDLYDIFMGGKKGAAKDKYKFWETQPVPDLKETVERHGPIDDEKTPSDVLQEPYPLPGGFEWCSVDVTDNRQLVEVYELLTKHYVEDDDNMFRFDYKEAFLQWALQPPGYYPDWHVGVRQTKGGQLRGFIAGIPTTCHAYDKSFTACEINFLCVHKKLRSKRLAPVLIKEVTRRVNLKNIWQAVYTAGVVIPKPVASCRYYHRSLNPKKLIEVEFSRLGPRQTLPRLIKLAKLPAEPVTPGFRKMEERDIPGVAVILREYLSRFKLWLEFDEEECRHWLLPREGVVDSFVVEDPSTGKVTDFGSFYHLPSSVMNNPKHSKLNAAYSFYNVALSIPMKQLVNDMLIMARTLDFDVFNALDLMENREFLEDLKFHPGDGNLQYYLYNWACPEVEHHNVGIVLL